MMKRFSLQLHLSLLFLLLLMGVACKKKHAPLHKEEILSMGMQKDAKMAFLPPDKDDPHFPSCHDYGHGCVEVLPAKVFGINIIFIQFMEAKQAKVAALRMNGLYKDNWAFDDVTGEPILEKFVQETFEAQRAYPPTVVPIPDPTRWDYLDKKQK